jgi:hypothetical protein
MIGSANLPLQKPEDAPQSDVAAPATQSEPSLERSTRNNTGAEAAASSPVPQGIQQHVSTRSPSPVSLGAARSSSTSSAPPTEAADKSTQSQSQSQPQNQSPSKSSSQNKGPVETFSSHLSAPNQESGQNKPPKRCLSNNHLLSNVRHLTLSRVLLKNPQHHLSDSTLKSRLLNTF